MKRIKMYDVSNPKDLQAMKDLEKLDSEKHVMGFLNHITAHDLYLAACSDKHFYDILKKLTAMARKVLREA
jgi:hypothetical protein